MCIIALYYELAKSAVVIFLFLYSIYYSLNALNDNDDAS